MHLFEIIFSSRMKTAAISKTSISAAMAPKKQPVTQDLLARGHSPDSANRLFTEKIQHRPLLLRASSPQPSTARDERRRARTKKEKERKKALKPKPLSARQKRKLGLYDVPREGQKYALFVPLHRLWLGYAREILGNEVYTGGQAAAAKLSSAEVHGAEVEVVRSGCVSRVGIKGIVIKDTKFAFEIITPKNTLKIVPKEGTVFRIEVPAKDEERAAPQPQPVDHPELGGLEQVRTTMTFEIHGNQFRYRSADRSGKKFKLHFLKDI